MREAKRMLKVEIESGRSSEMMRLLAANHRVWSVEARLQRDAQVPLARYMWATLRNQPTAQAEGEEGENEVHRIQGLAS